ncbi:MAG: hypothetical protein HGB12_04530 [Bacteroidetes bacterium]|nr:hypothetical protein [Bacteroidota bacterium]
MNGAHLHLILCHIPIIGAGFTILLLLFAFAQKSKELKRTSLWFAVITGAAALVVYLTGDSAEEVAKLIPGITETIIEPHEEYALFYFISLLLIGCIALAGLFLSRASSSALHKFAVLVFVLNLLATILAVKTGYTGGKIRHTEIENTTTVK